MVGENVENADLLEAINNTVNAMNSELNPRIFKTAALKNFLQKVLAEMNPEMSIQTTTLDYFEIIFNKYIFPKIAFIFW
jgi:hypothetical protein